MLPEIAWQKGFIEFGGILKLEDSDHDDQISKTYMIMMTYRDDGHSPRHANRITSLLLSMTLRVVVRLW